MATMKEPIDVVITGAAGQIAYSLIYLVAKGDVFGSDQPLVLHLLDIPLMMEVLNGVVMEIRDCALPLVHDVIPTDKLDVAFKNASAVFLVGAMPRRQGMERKDLLSANVKIFKDQGKAIDTYAKKDVKVLVVGNPANTNALICSKYAPSIPKENFSAMTRLDQNRAFAQIAEKLNTNVTNVSNVFIWGNHSSTQFPDASNAKVNLNNKQMGVYEAVNDKEWLENEFVEIIQKRGATIIAARKMSSAMSAAKAAGDHMHDWWYGTQPGKYVSMAVLSDGSYGTPKDTIFSFPVEIQNRNWKIVQGLTLSSYAQTKIQITAKELLEERDEALSICEENNVCGKL